MNTYYESNPKDEKLKPWDWGIVSDKGMWLMPCEESYYYAEKWKRENYRSVLDLGCGLGRHAMLFAKYGFKTTAVDISSEAVEYLKKWQIDESVDILCKKADMSCLPFADDAFDCVFAMHSAGHTDTKGMKQILSEISRVLKPNGTVFITLCSKETPSFTEGKVPAVDENTLLKTEGPEQGVPHFYVNLEDIVKLFSGYEIIKVRHIDECYNNGSNQSSKHYFIEARILKQPALLDYSDIIGTTVSGKIDRPLGSYHPKNNKMLYPINYGYIEGVFALDGAEQDVYLLGSDVPLSEFTGTVIAVYHRLNDNEDKWIVSYDGRDFSDEEILRKIDFQEKYFDGFLIR